jgi:hypothetical protein
MTLLDEALLQFSKVSALSDPEEYNMRSLRNWLLHAADGRVLDAAGPVETWGDLDDIEPSGNLRTVLSALVWARVPPKADLDLAVTHSNAKIDGLTKWVVYFGGTSGTNGVDGRRRERQMRKLSQRSRQRARS